MNSKRNSVAIVCGGRSLEHSFSIVSAKNISNHLSSKYKIIILCIDYDGNWHYGTTNDFINEDSLLTATFDWKNTPIVHICQNGILLHNQTILDKIRSCTKR